MLGGSHDPAKYESQQAKERFAVAKYYGMGSDGEWTAPEIAEALDVSKRQVYRYIHESEVGEEVRQVLATTEAEWRLDLALKLRSEVERLEGVIEELSERKKAVPTGFETKTVKGVPTGKRNIKLPEGAANNGQSYKLKLPVPTNYETVTDYGADLEKAQKEKRQYLKQISDLLGLNESDKRAIDETLAGRHDEVKIVELRRVEDQYPEAEPIDLEEAEAEDVEEGVTTVDYEEDPDTTDDQGTS